MARISLVAARSGAVRVRDGFTVSTHTAAFARIGEQYVMRDNNGHQVAFPLDTDPEHMREVWVAFQSAAVDNTSMPAMLYGETVQSSSPG